MMILDYVRFTTIFENCPRVTIINTEINNPSNPHGGPEGHPPSETQATVTVPLVCSPIPAGAQPGARSQPGASVLGSSCSWWPRVAAELLGDLERQKPYFLSVCLGCNRNGAGVPLRNLGSRCHIECWLGPWGDWTGAVSAVSCGRVADKEESYCLEQCEII